MIVNRQQERKAEINVRAGAGVLLIAYFDEKVHDDLDNYETDARLSRGVREDALCADPIILFRELIAKTLRDRASILGEAEPLRSVIF